MSGARGSRLLSTCGTTVAQGAFVMKGGRLLLWGTWVGAIATWSTAACSSAEDPVQDDVVDEALEARPGIDDFSASPDFTVRQRILFDRGTTERFDGEPFSHRARKWHVYPLSLYDTARISMALATDDRAFAPRAEVRLYGPLRNDGHWPEPLRFQADAQGKIAALPKALRAGRYAIAVGPKDASAFLPRYPSDLAWFALDGAQILGQIERKDDAWLVHTKDKGSYRIVSPQPGREAASDPKAGSEFRLMPLAGGREQRARLDRWSITSTFVTEFGTYDERLIGNVGGEGDRVLSLSPSSDPRDERAYWVKSAVTLPGSAQPVLYKAYPRVVPPDGPAGLVGKELGLFRAGCADDTCIVPVIIEGAKTCRDAADCGGGLVCSLEGRCGRKLSSRDDSAVEIGIKPTFYDPGESSKYSLTVQCLDNCDRATGVPRSTPRNPVYYAHGFNASKESWAPLFSKFAAKLRGFTTVARAESVAPFRPTEDRSDDLRRQLTSFIREQEAARGGESVRINVVAHSMGGLDTRHLLSNPKYNERCGELACVDRTYDAKGNVALEKKVTCCAPPDRSGRTMWRDRIVSLTTLSTPHQGSAFADWGLDKMARAGHFLDALTAKALGLDAAGVTLFKSTLSSLSRPYGTSIQMTLPVPNDRRAYSWACATGAEACSVPAGAELPRRVRDGNQVRYLLPSPTSSPTVFSWSAVSCVTGACGDIVDPGLLLPYGIMKAFRDDPSDGVVSAKSAVFGIHMGVVAADHFDWTRLGGESGTERFFGRLFGVKPEPFDRFHAEWLARLAEAGY